MEPFEQRSCAFCMIPIPMGVPYHVERTVVGTVSDKSGRPRNLVEEDHALHYQCLWPWRQRNDGREYDALVDLIRPQIRKDVEEEFSEEKYLELYESMRDDIIQEYHELQLEEEMSQQEQPQAPPMIPVPYYGPNSY